VSTSACFTIIFAKLEALIIFYGNSAWAFDLLSRPEVQNLDVNVHAFDISDAQFPPKFLWPKNCTFNISDALSEPAEEFCGRFDIVHIRLFACVRALGEDPRAVCQHAWKLLSMNQPSVRTCSTSN
jgi:hypothetical protein